jgi:conjugative relaxase-like TrwC/TraI family protein
MLSIGKLGSGQERYYLDKVAEGAEDYYSGEGEAAGYWLGDAAGELGLEGHVEPDQLIAMLTGANPATGEPLGLRHVAGRGPVPGFDLTFSAPKSVSLAWALGGEDAGTEIAAAHAASVEAALDYLQREACWTRRGHGGAEFVHGNGFIAAAYVHRTSRAGDPQLHTHVLIANATKGPDGRWTRLYHPAIYNHAKTASYIYEAVLRDELTRRFGAGAAELLAVLPDAERAIWATAFYAGLRRGELQALRCMDIDLSADLLHVRKGWDQVEGEIEPKSESSKRTIPLLAVARALLEAQIQVTGRSGEDRVFGRSAREVFYPSTVDKRAKRAWMQRNAAEREVAREEERDPKLLTLLTMHECRHTFASVLIDAGANPKVIQEIMGHSKIQTTFDVYGHLLPDSFDEVREKMNVYLSSSLAAS